MQFWLWFLGLVLSSYFCQLSLYLFLYLRTVLFLLLPSSAISIETISSCISQRTLCSPYLRSASVFVEKSKTVMFTKVCCLRVLEDSFSLLQALCLSVSPCWNFSITFREPFIQIQSWPSDEVNAVSSLPFGCWQFSRESKPAWQTLMLAGLVWGASAPH